MPWSQVSESHVLLGVGAAVVVVVDGTVLLVVVEVVGMPGPPGAVVVVVDDTVDDVVVDVVSVGFPGLPGSIGTPPPPPPPHAVKNNKEDIAAILRQRTPGCSVTECLPVSAKRRCRVGSLK